ncbi:MAG TPA: sugar phosphate isomerase/epimerase family protein [Limnochordia bacterium]
MERVEPIAPPDGGRTDPEAWAIGTSTSLFGAPAAEHFDACREAGIRCIELVLAGGGNDPSTDAGIRTIEARAAAIAASGLTLWSVHLPFGGPWDIAALDSSARAWAIRAQEELLGVAGSLGAQVAVIHPSAEPIADADRATAMALSREAFERLAQVARRHGVRLAAECLPRTCLARDSSEMAEILTASDALGICFDSNHLLTETPASFLERHGPRVVTVHLSDYDGVDERHWLPGRGVVDWPAVIARLAAAGYRGPAMFEVSPKRAVGPIGPADLVACWKELVARYRREEAASAAPPA